MHNDSAELSQRLHEVTKRMIVLEKTVVALSQQLSPALLDARLRALVYPVDQHGRPNLSFSNLQHRDSEWLRQDVKQLGYEMARRLYRENAPCSAIGPSHLGLVSKPSTQGDMDSIGFRWWCREMKLDALYHRKIWEFCYLAQVLHENDLLRAGVRGLAFAVGEESTPAFFAARDMLVHATDAPLDVIADSGWVATNQHSSRKENLFIHANGLCDRERFERNVTFEPVDMRAIPHHLDGKFDFCWSLCSFEHLGTLRRGMDFVVESMRTLRPGGLAIHTTEFNYTQTTNTIDNWSTVLYRRSDLEALAAELAAEGHEVFPLSFDVGDLPMDNFIDIPPYNRPGIHMRLAVDGFPCTSYGLIVRKKE